MNEGNNSRKPWWQWWQTLPGILTGGAGTIGAIATLIVAVSQTGWFGDKGKLKPFYVDALANCATPLQHSNMLPTGIKLQQGDLFNISAAGEWWASKGDQYDETVPSSNKRKSDANGIQWAKLEGIYIGALVGKIGTGPVFFLGRDYYGPASASGELFLGYWDNYCEDNAGLMTVTVIHGS